MVEQPHGTPEPTDGGSRPVPDPTSLTTEQLLRAIAAEHTFTVGEIKVLNEHLRGIDSSLDLRLKTIDGIPAVVDEKVDHLSTIMDGRFDAVAQQFSERDTRSERESRDNKERVDAAFAAQEKSAAKDDEKNQKAIDKSEKTTIETINKNAQLAESTNRALQDRVTALERRYDRLEGSKIGGQEQQGQVRDTQRFSMAIAGLIVTIIVAGLAIAGAVAAGPP